MLGTEAGGGEQTEEEEDDEEEDEDVEDDWNRFDKNMAIKCGNIFLNE